MSLETVSGAMLLFYILFVPIVIFGAVLIAYSVKYCLEKRKENKPPDNEECRTCGSWYDIDKYIICPYCDGEDEEE